MFVVGSTIGEAVVPVLIGIAMSAGGSLVLGYAVIAAIFIIVIIYIVVHTLIVMGCFAKYEDSKSGRAGEEGCENLSVEKTDEDFCSTLPSGDTST